MVARRAILAVSASVIVAGCSATGAYGGYTKGEAKDAGRYGLEQLAQQARTQYKQPGLPADFSPEGYALIGAEHSKAFTGSDAWLVTFVNEQLGDQVCIHVWRNDETGDSGRWQQVDC